MFVAGCKKNNGTTPAPVYLPGVIKVTANGVVTDSTVYKYDDQNRLIERLDAPNLNSDYKFTYDANDRLTEIDVYWSGTSSEKRIYTYGTGVVTEQVSGYRNGILAGTETITYTLNPVQKVTRMDISPSGEHDVYTYDAGGNVATFDQYSGNNPSVPGNAFVYSYDIQKNPFLNVKGDISVFDPAFSSANNIIKLTQTTTNPANTNVHYVYNTTSTYAYNADGYPTSRTDIITGTTDPHIAVTYTYIIK